MDDRPHRVRVRTDKPQYVLAAALALHARVITEAGAVHGDPARTPLVRRHAAAALGDVPAEVAAFVAHNVEVFNGRPGDARPDTPLSPGDSLEIVSPMQGG